MSRLKLASLALTSIVATVGLTAPAHASSYVLYKSFGWGDACTSAGYAGEQAGQWVAYYCDTIAPSSWDGPGLYDLYVLYS
jgi:hypothetical protein